MTTKQVCFLTDNAISPRFSAVLSDQGFDSIHVREIDLHKAEDEVVLEYARTHNRVLVSFDTDFGALLAESRNRRPSIIIFRVVLKCDIDRLKSLLLSKLPGLLGPLEKGAIVIIDDNCTRVKELPIKKNP